MSRAPRRAVINVSLFRLEQVIEPKGLPESSEGQEDGRTMGQSSVLQSNASARGGLTRRGGLVGSNCSMMSPGLPCAGAMAG